jgi:SAM-dependent methyltransferase
MDLGCGPGRHAEYLHRAGLRVLGVDASATAVALTRSRGVDTVCADALGPLPTGDHGWDGIVLLDGNIGIGGDPLLLLCRIRDLLAPNGRVLVELDASGASDRFQAVLDDGQAASATFPWARLSHGVALDAAACAADLRLADSWTQHGQAFVVLRSGRRS